MGFKSHTTIHSRRWTRFGILASLQIRLSHVFCMAETTKNKREQKFDFSVRDVMTLNFFVSQHAKTTPFECECVARNCIWSLLATATQHGMCILLKLNFIHGLRDYKHSRPLDASAHIQDPLKYAVGIPIRVYVSTIEHSVQRPCSASARKKKNISI